MAWIIQSDQQKFLLFTNLRQDFQDVQNKIKQPSQQVLQQIVQSLKQQNINYVLKRSESSKMEEILFSLKILKKYQLLYRFRIDSKDLQLKMDLILAFNFELTYVKSHELIKNLMKQLKNINQRISKTVFFIICHPANGQISTKIRTNIKLLHQNILLIKLMKFVINQTHQLLNLFALLIFNSINLVSSQRMILDLPQKLKNMIFGKGGTFARSAQIRQLLPLLRCNLQNYQNKGSYPDLKNIRDYLRQIQQRQRIIEQQQVLWIQPKLFKKEKIFHEKISLDSLQKCIKYPESNYESKDNPYIFSTICIISQQDDPRQQRSPSTTNKLNIEKSLVKFTYGSSQNIDDQDSSDNKIDEFQQLQKISSQGNQRTIFHKKMIIKRANKKDLNLVSKLRWEKLILSNFRNSRCSYLPKYYHTVQKHYKHRQSLFIDYIQGLTYHQQTQLKKLTMNMDRKLYFAAHIANAVRFLQRSGVTHLDLTPSNIIVRLGQTIKIIDFGQSYCESTFNNPILKKMHIQYQPGVTYPFYAPQIMKRKREFASSQDIYSLGVMLYKQFFGGYPYQLSEKSLSNIYLKQAFNHRLFFTPQKVDYIGSPPILMPLAALLIKMLHQNQNQRPYPLWVFLILSKLTTYI